VLFWGSPGLSWGFTGFIGFIGLTDFIYEVPHSRSSRGVVLYLLVQYIPRVLLTMMSSLNTQRKGRSIHHEVSRSSSSSVFCRFVSMSYIFPTSKQRSGELCCENPFIDLHLPVLDNTVVALRDY